jgi:ADP-heptose:LPS heptosyltransferase
LISLQKTEERQERDAAGRSPIINPGNDVDTDHGAFVDTAAIMMNLDLVVTSDTSIAHLAGALGVPVWVVLPHAPNWRWLLDRSDCPWYPTMRLFRQQEAGNWTAVFEEIGTALGRLIATRA